MGFQGRAAILEAVAKAYQEGGREVYALGADNAAASALQDKGLAAQNVYRFLYRDHFAHESMQKGSVIIHGKRSTIMAQFRLTHKFASDLKVSLREFPRAQFHPLDDWICDVFSLSL